MTTVSNTTDYLLTPSSNGQPSAVGDYTFTYEISINTGEIITLYCETLKPTNLINSNTTNIPNLAISGQDGFFYYFPSFLTVNYGPGTQHYFSRCTPFTQQYSLTSTTSFLASAGNLTFTASPPQSNSSFGPPVLNQLILNVINSGSPTSVNAYNSAPIGATTYNWGYITATNDSTPNFLGCLSNFQCVPFSPNSNGQPPTFFDFTQNPMYIAGPAVPPSMCESLVSAMVSLNSSPNYVNGVVTQIINPFITNNFCGTSPVAPCPSTPSFISYQATIQFQSASVTIITDSKGDKSIISPPNMCFTFVGTNNSSIQLTDAKGNAIDLTTRIIKLNINSNGLP